MKLAYFIHNNNKYPFDLTIFNKHSNYFSNLEKTYFYLIDEFDSVQYIPKNSIQTFIDYCQDKVIEINELNVISIFKNLVSNHHFY